MLAKNGFKRCIRFLFILLISFGSYYAIADTKPDTKSNSKPDTNSSSASNLNSNSAPNSIPNNDTDFNAANSCPDFTDPFESLNRVIFTFNDTLDRLILKPVAGIYIAIMPKPFAKGLSNFYNNIDTVGTILNDILQLNFYQASSDTWRLAINSTVGVAGFFDVATPMGLEANVQDFGLTLARWGYTKSMYLVVPFLGPSTLRDAISWPVNYYYLSVYPYVRPWQAQWGLYLGGLVVRRADLLQYEGVTEAISVDKYLFVRDAYLQHRNYLIEHNKELANPCCDANKIEQPLETPCDNKSEAVAKTSVKDKLAAENKQKPVNYTKNAQ